MTQTPLVYYASINLGREVFSLAVVVKDAFAPGQTVLDIRNLQCSTTLLELLLWHPWPATGLAGHSPALTCTILRESRSDFILLSPPIWLTAYGVVGGILLAKISRYHRHTHSFGQKAEVKHWYIFRWEPFPPHINNSLLLQ